MTAPRTQSRLSIPPPPALARRAMRHAASLENVLKGLNAREARVRFGCAKALRLISEQRPDLLYPHFDFFVRLLDHDNKIFQWEGARVLSRLVRVDAEDRFEAIFDKYFAPVGGPIMITAANVIRGGALVALAKPRLAGRIAREIMKIARARYQTPECRNVAIGHAILALGELFDLLQNPAPVIRFVRNQTRNPRPATRKKAEQFLGANALSVNGVRESAADGLRRCAWAKGELYIAYHDREWGVPVHDDRRLFEFLILEGAQAGLSWITILKKRGNYRRAFDNFKAHKVARYDARKVRKLLADPGIVRTRLKIESAVQNARAFLAVQKEFGSFDRYIWRFVGGAPIRNHWKSLKEVPARTAESDAVSRDLLKRGFKFVGSTIGYAFMQAVGMVNDHTTDCFRYGK